MGAKTWMLVYARESAREALSTRPQLDREATKELVGTLFPADKLEVMGDGDLSFTCPPDDEVHAGCFAGVAVVAAREFGIDYPSTAHAVQAITIMVEVLAGRPDGLPQGPGPLAGVRRDARIARTSARVHARPSPLASARHRS